MMLSIVTGDFCVFLAVDLVTDDSSRKILIGDDPIQDNKPQQL